MLPYIPITSGTDFTGATISQYYYWPNLRETFSAYFILANFLEKKVKQKYVHFPSKEAEYIPRERLLVDLIADTEFY